MLILLLVEELAGRCGRGRCGCGRDELLLLVAEQLVATQRARLLLLLLRLGQIADRQQVAGHGWRN